MESVIYVPGLKYEHIFRFSTADVNSYMDLTGDRNNIHYDEAAAKDSPIGLIALPGTLAISVFSRIFGTLFPGHGTVYKSQGKYKHIKPLLVDTNYLAIVEVVEVKQVRQHRTINFSTKIVSQDRGTIFLMGEALVINNKVNL